MTPAVGTVGRFTTDSVLVVQTWDAWMSAVTGIPESAARDTPIATLFPELAERGMLARLRRVAQGNAVEVLAPALHRYLIPCAPRDPASRLEHMRQHVIVSPILDETGAAGVSVTIEDVTERFDRAHTASIELESQQESIRLRAATALAADASSAALLSASLADESWRVRRVAAESLAASTDHDVIPMLLQAVREHHRDPALLNSALTALGRSRQDIALDVIPLLASEEADVRTYCALALGLVGDTRAVRPLLDALGDADANVRYHAIEALGRIGDQRAADALVRIALSRDFFLAFPALDALAAIGDSSIAPALLALLDDPFLAESTANCLGAIALDDVIVPLVRAIERTGAPVAAFARAIADIAARLDTDADESALVAELVRSSATTSTAQALIDALASANDDERPGLAIVLSWLSFGGIDAALAGLLEHELIRRLAADRLAGRGVGARPIVEAMAHHADSDVRRAVAFALGGIGSTDSTPVLLSMLEGEQSSDLIINVVAALGAIGDPRPFDALLDLLDHEDTTVRQATVAALNSISHPRLEEATAIRLSDPSPRVRESAARIAGYFTYASCLDAVIALTTDGETPVRRSAVEALATYDTASSWAAIRAAVTSDADPTVRAAGARALSQSASTESCVTLVGALTDGNLWVRYHAARSCGRCGNPDVDMISALITRLMTDRATPVRVTAIEALSDLGVTSLLAPLAATVSDSDDDVSCAALLALGKYPGDEASRILVHAFEHGHSRQQHAALDAMSAQAHEGERAELAIARLAGTSSDIPLVRHATETLGKLGGAAAVSALIGLSRIPSRFADVARALSPSDDSALPTLESALATAANDDKPVLLIALARSSVRGAARIVATELNNASERVRRVAEQSLLQIDRRTL